MGNNSRFTDGLLFGALIGGAAVFLLGTKKGNRVLKTLTEEGIAGFNDLIDEIEEARVDAREAREAMEDPIDGEEIEEVNEVIEEVPQANGNGENHASYPKPKSSSKRFFRKK